nr:hypothetical protein [Tanacetum cinerariifolium]
SNICTGSTNITRAVIIISRSIFHITSNNFNSTKKLLILTKLSLDLSQKLKGVLTLTLEEQLAADTMKALKESKKISRRHPNSRGLSKGTCSITGVPNESTMVFSPSNEGTGTKPEVPNEEKVTSEAKATVTLDWGLEEESEYTKEDDDDENIEWVDTDEKEEKNDEKSIDREKTDDEETNDEFVHNAEKAKEVKDDTKKVELPLSGSSLSISSGLDNQFLNLSSDTSLIDAEKAKEVKDDTKKVELPLSGSSLSISSGLDNQFLNLSSDTSLIGTIKDTTDAEINSLLDV